MRTFKTCISIIRLKIAEGVQYRASALTSGLTGIFWGIIEIVVYTVFYTYAQNKGAGVSAGMTLKQAISYAWLSEILMSLQLTNVDYDILQKIDSGDVGIELCRPIDLYFNWYARMGSSHLAPFFYRGIVVLIAAILMPPAYRLMLPASAAGLLCMLLSVFSAALLCPAFGMVACALRLNIAWGDGPTNMILMVGMVLSGSYLPLQLWPAFMQKFLLFQPFAGYLDIPARLYIGTMQPRDAIWAIALQLFWTFLFILLGRLLMRRRMKDLVVQGG